MLGYLVTCSGDPTRHCPVTVNAMVYMDEHAQWFTSFVNTHRCISFHGDVTKPSINIRATKTHVGVNFFCPRPKCLRKLAIF
jgi:hypothetical protein